MTNCSECFYTVRNLMYLCNNVNCYNVGMLKALGGPFPDVRFCPTGGLGPDNFRQFLDLPNVVCCGGSWMVSSELVENGRWDEIEQLAREAMSE